jgi:hypothetical protein
LPSARGDALGRGSARGARLLARGALGDTSGRGSIDCSREQIEQFWIRRLWRQKVGTASSSHADAPVQGETA